MLGRTVFDLCIQSVASAGVLFANLVLSGDLCGFRGALPGTLFALLAGTIGYALVVFTLFEVFASFESLAL